MALRRRIKALMPPAALRRLLALLQWWERRRLDRAEQRLASLPVGDAFDEIYRRGHWGAKGSSGRGSSGAWADGYVEIVARMIAERGVASVADVGCGDFQIGARLAHHVSGYVGLDVSRVIVERNRRRFAALDHVVFETMDLVEGPPPPVDLVLVRQVLQHLSNAQIERGLGNLERSGARMILVAEHVCLEGERARPNLDLGRHTMRIRASVGSGVFLDRPPFSRQVRHIADLPDPLPENAGMALRLVELVPRSGATQPVEPRG